MLHKAGKHQLLYVFEATLIPTRHGDNARERRFPLLREANSAVQLGPTGDPTNGPPGLPASPAHDVTLTP